MCAFFRREASILSSLFIHRHKVQIYLALMQKYIIHVHKRPVHMTHLTHVGTQGHDKSGPYYGRRKRGPYRCLRGRRKVISSVTAGCLAPERGRVKMKRAPAPGAFSAQMRPPCASTMARTMARPRPLPPVFD